MVRLVKRYGSRKLYDTEESRYVSLEEVAAFVRAGQEVRVVDNATDEDVTSPTLTQIILEEGRSGGRRALPAALLHELVRLGGRRLRQGVDQVQNGASSLLQAALERWTPVREARAELDLLRDRLAELEAILARLAAADAGATVAGGGVAEHTADAGRAHPPRRPRATRRGGTAA